MKEFIKVINDNNNLLGVFENEGETGYLYCYSPEERKIYMNLIIYDYQIVKSEPLESDVQLIYNNDSHLCGVYVWGKLRGYINFFDKSRKWLRFFLPDDLGISDAALPEKYEEVLSAQNKYVDINENNFVEDRQNYWKDLAEKIKNTK